MPDDFELSLVATSKAVTRTVDKQGRISFKRYRLYVRGQLRHQRVQIRELFDSVVVSYRSGTVVSYECAHQQSQIRSIQNTPVFHQHPDICDSCQLELFDLSKYEFRYVARRTVYRRKRYKTDATQLTLFQTKR